MGQTQRRGCWPRLASHPGVDRAAPGKPLSWGRGGPRSMPPPAKGWLGGGCSEPARTCSPRGCTGSSAARGISAGTGYFCLRRARRARVFCSGDPARTAGVQPAGPGEQQQQQQQRLQVGQRLQAAGDRARGGGGWGGSLQHPSSCRGWILPRRGDAGRRSWPGGCRLCCTVGRGGGCTAGTPTGTRPGRGCCRMSEHVPIVRANNGPVSGSFLALNTIAFFF